ncbi:MAG: DUF4357 domain-containing protein [Verrucomicrobia bacterium]|nr:DUF4357 domain-containing protein [Verrucomicrobiota bacterium]
MIVCGYAGPVAAPAAAKWPYVLNLRKQLIADRTLVETDGFFQFTKDVLFTSPSAAAAVVEGGSANGLIEWRTKDGRVLKELDEALWLCLSI